MTTLIDHNAALPAGYLPTADQVIVEVDGAPLRVVRYAHFDVPLYLVHASLPGDGPHAVRVVIKRYWHALTVHPLRLGLSPQVDGKPLGKKGLEFTITGHPHLVIQCDGLGHLLLRAAQSSIQS